MRLRLSVIPSQEVGGDASSARQPSHRCAAVSDATAEAFLLPRKKPGTLVVVVCLLDAAIFLTRGALRGEKHACA
jgi:hypothetical protein